MDALKSKSLKYWSMKLGLCQGIFSLARIGEREDYRQRDDWGDIRPWSKSSWKNRLGQKLPVTYSGAILAICVLLFLANLLSGGLVNYYLALIPSQLLERPWTIITYMFVHANFDHLFWNMLFLFFFGMELEKKIGENRFLGIFLISGVVAALGQMFLTSGSMVGASGALYGVLGCLAIIAPEIRILLFFVIPLSIRAAVVVFALIDFMTIGSADNIAHMAHIIGLLVGLAAGWVLQKHPSRRYYSW